MVEKAISGLTQIIHRCHPLELISRVAIYTVVGNPDKLVPESMDRSEVHLEYLISLSTAFPYPQAAQMPSPEDIQTTIELLTMLHQGESAWHFYDDRSASDQDIELGEIVDTFRLNRLHVRGDGFWRHLKQTTIALLSPHDSRLYALLGFRYGDYLNLFERAEQTFNDRIEVERSELAAPYASLLKPWLKAIEDRQNCSDEELARFDVFVAENAGQISELKQRFDLFGTPGLFIVSPRGPEQAEVLKSFSCTFGENKAFHGAKPEHAFRPLTDTLTEKKPIIL